MEMLKVKKYLLPLFFAIFVLPRVVFGQILINEIMYNPEGTDGGFEWVEIYNSGDSDIDFTTYKFFENNVNHKISAVVEENSVLGAGKFAVLVDNIDKFLSTHSFSGLIFDSAFSLNNTGEAISLTDSENNVIHQIEYSSEWGANGDGNSLQLNEDVWIPAEPTPGTENSNIPVENDESESGNNANNSNSGSDSDSTHSSQANLTDFKEKIELKIGAGRHRYATANAPIEFWAENNQEDKRKVKNIWSFGDGTTDRGENVSHTYNFAGEYNVVLNARYENDQAVSRTKVTDRDSNILVKLQKRGELVDILLENRGQHEVNLGEFIVKIVDNPVENIDFVQDSATKNVEISFKIGRDTIVSSKQKIIIPSEISGFYSTSQNLDLFLLYPNRKIATTEYFVQRKLSENLPGVFSLEEIQKLNTIIEKTKLGSW